MVSAHELLIFAGAIVVAGLLLTAVVMFLFVFLPLWLDGRRYNEEHDLP